MAGAELFEAMAQRGEVSIQINEPRLAAYRELAGISSWKELSEACGLTVETIKQARAGSNFTVETWMRLAYGVNRHPLDVVDILWPEEMAPKVSAPTEAELIYA